MLADKSAARPRAVVDRMAARIKGVWSSRPEACSSAETWVVL
jgi:hypothetical protein